MDKDKIDKKDHILDVAERVFSEVGFDGASTRMISGEAGVNMAMLNYYFGSKEGLFLAVFERKSSSFKHILQNIGNDTSMLPATKLERFVDTYVDRIVANNCFQKLINREASMSKRSELADKLADILMINITEFQRILEEGIKIGDFKKDTDIVLITATIFGTKNYIINNANISSRMLGYDVRDQKNLEEQLRPRMKKYMNSLLKAYLLNENDN